jgi:hypothetical protein
MRPSEFDMVEIVERGFIGLGGACSSSSSDLWSAFRIFELTELMPYLTSDTDPRRLGLPPPRLVSKARDQKTPKATDCLEALREL